MMEYEKVLSQHSLPKYQTLGGDKINKKVWCKHETLLWSDIYKLAPLLPKKENT
jgi:hypothetical protein